MFVEAFKNYVHLLPLYVNINYRTIRRPGEKWDLIFRDLYLIYIWHSEEGPYLYLYLYLISLTLPYGRTQATKWDHGFRSKNINHCTALHCTVPNFALFWSKQNV